MKQLLIIGLLLVSFHGYAQNPRADQVDTQGRVVAFGDVHGAYPELVALLSELEVIDADLNWSGATTHLVSLGDLIDRGSDSRRVVELLMKLDRQATEAGGGFHMVLGNHEVMVMTGDLRYVSRQEFAAFAADEDPVAREALFAEYASRLTDVPEAEARVAFDKAMPPGFLGLQHAYSAEGELGRWLLQWPVVLRVNQTLYAHGGLGSMMAEKPLSEINRDARATLTDYLKIIDSLHAAGVLPASVGFWDRRQWLNIQAQQILAEDARARPDWFVHFARLDEIHRGELEQDFLFSSRSPIWYRGNVYCHPYAESFNTERALKLNTASQLVVGHTPSPSGVKQRMDASLIRLDTGMLRSVYKGRVAALVQEGATQYVHYLGVAEPAQPEQSSRSLSQQNWSMSDAEVEAVLRDSEILSSEFIGTGITKPKRLELRSDTGTVTASFKYEDTNPGLERAGRYLSRKHNESDRFQYDIAAYELDRMLGLEMVPVGVLRDIDDQSGAVIAWLPDTINERDRMEEELPFDSACAKEEQYRLRFIFDVLTYNEDRNLTNILWTKDDYMLRFIDHSLAFRSTEKRPHQYRKVTLRLSDLFRKQLADLNEDNVSQRLGSYLHPRQIEAILARRDMIIRQAERTDP